MRQAAESLGILNAVGVVKSQPSPLSGQKMISGLREGARPGWVVVSLCSLLSPNLLKVGDKVQILNSSQPYRVHVSLNIYQLKQRINSETAGHGTATVWVGINLTTGWI